LKAPTAIFQKTDFGDSIAFGNGITKIVFIIRIAGFYGKGDQDF
jgi:hypothetical protein